MPGRSTLVAISPHLPRSHISPTSPSGTCLVTQLWLRATRRAACAKWGGGVRSPQISSDLLRSRLPPISPSDLPKRGGGDGSGAPRTNTVARAAPNVALASRASGSMCAAAGNGPRPHLVAILPARPCHRLGAWAALVEGRGGQELDHLALWQVSHLPISPPDPPQISSRSPHISPRSPPVKPLLWPSLSAAPRPLPSWSALRAAAAGRCRT